MKRVRGQVPVDPRQTPFEAALTEILGLHVRKSADYGSGNDPLANLHNCADFGVEPWRYAVLRINDNMWRLKAFIEKGKLENDPPEETLKDIASFAVLALVLLREQD